MIKNKLNEYKLLLRSVPSTVLVIFVLSVIFMNLFGGRELYNSEWLCLNNGIIFSWIPFICMDCICKRFGTKAAIKINIVAVIFEILVSIVFFIVSILPGTWSAAFSAESVEIGAIINNSINSTFAGTWYVVFGSVVSMVLSGIVNAILNGKIGKHVNDRYTGFAARSLISTVVSQFVDNIVFATLVSYVLFGWSIKQVIVCSITSMIIEFILEAILTPIGYKISKTWEMENVGCGYIERYTNESR